MTKTHTVEEMRTLRDQYHWRADMELRINGATPKFHQLARSYHVLCSEVGYPEEETNEQV